MDDPDVLQAQIRYLLECLREFERDLPVGAARSHRLYREALDHRLAELAETLRAYEKGYHFAVDRALATGRDLAWKEMLEALSRPEFHRALSERRVGDAAQALLATLGRLQSPRRIPLPRAPGALPSSPISERYGEVRYLLDLGRSRGYLHFDEINEILPESINLPEEIDEIFLLFDENGIQVVDS